MKAVFFEQHGPLDVLKYADFPDPELKPGWVKVKVRACALNYIDVFARKGLPGIKVPLPFITGGDCAGEIAALGAGVEGWKSGERVLINPAFLDMNNGLIEIMGENRPGALAEYCVCRAEQLIRIPDHVSDEKAAALPMAYGTAHRMLYVRTSIKPGEKVLVLGASGGVGNACVLLAKRAGAHVIAAAGSDEKCDRLRAMGADETINYTAEPFDKYIRRTTGSLFRGGGVDVVVNFTGGSTWAPSLRCVKRFGRVLTCGGTAGYEPPTDIKYIFMSEMSIIGSTGFYTSDIQACLDMVAAGEIDPPIGAVMPLSDAIEACRMIEQRDFFGKLVIKP